MNRSFRLNTKVKILSLAALLAVTGLVTAPSSSFAQGFGSVPSARQVIVGGVLFLTVRDAWGGLTPEQRATQVQERINEALSQGPIHVHDITVAKVDGDWIVELKGKRLYTADYDTAKLDDTAPQALANQWAAFLQSTLPGLTAPTNRPPSGTAPVSAGAPSL